MAKKRNHLGILLFALIVLLIYFFNSSNLFAREGTIISDDLYDCKIVVEGNHCAEYSLCVYSPVRDLSCVKGYKLIITTNENPIPVRELIITSGGSSS